MNHFDVPTMFTTEAYLYCTVGLLILAFGFQRLSRGPLVWIALTFLLAGVAYVVSVTVGQQVWGADSRWLSNSLILTSYACLWSGLRRFSGKSVRWFWLCAAGALWLALSPWQWFESALTFRIQLFALITVAYLIASLVDILPVWRRDRRSVTPLLVILILHGLYYVYRMIPKGLTEATWLDSPYGVLMILESTLFIVGGSLSLLLMIVAAESRRADQVRLIDPLTGFPNRQGLFEWAALTWPPARSDQAGLIGVQCGIANLADINARHGQAAGDQALKFVAEALHHVASESQFCARLAGNELVVIMPGATLAAARGLAGQLHQTVAARGGSLAAAPVLRIGIASTSGVAGVDALLGVLRRAFREARNTGRDVAQVMRSASAV